MKKAKIILAISVSVLAVVIVCIIAFTRFSSTKSKSGDNNETTALAAVDETENLETTENTDDSESEKEFSVGDTIEYGSYPQSEVTDKKTLSALNAKVTEKDWQSYGYYSGTGEATSFWWLRSLGYHSDFACIVLGDGNVDSDFSDYTTEQTGVGIVPAFKSPMLTFFSDKGDIITYGSYPQSEVTDKKILSALNSKTLKWQSYGYYCGAFELSGGQRIASGKMVPSDYMRYADTEYNGERYRAVIFDSYRPVFTGYTSEVNQQQDNGYEINTVYWFKYEPLHWRVLDPKIGLLMCTVVIDSQAFNNYILSVDAGNECYYYGNAEKTYYANDYANSSIRQWLNNDFYFAAFSEEEQKTIKETELSNKGYCTLTDKSGYEYLDSADTADKVFLLSYDEVINANYGFSTVDSEEDLAKQLKPSDYAKCQGVENFLIEYERCNGEMVPSDYMRYADVEDNSFKYRAVKFDKYRPEYTGEKSSASESYQDDNGYKTGNIYWFKYEPLKWRILNPATGFVMCDSIVDSQPYNNYVLFENDEYYGNSGKTYYANDYANSSIRQWLNNYFYVTAFSEAEKRNIKETQLSNKGYYTLIGEIGYEYLDSTDTKDKIFLLSYSEVINNDYGFDENVGTEDPARLIPSSAYAKCQGLFDEKSAPSWLLRSPGSIVYDECGACHVFGEGRVSSFCITGCTNNGVVPALKLQNLKSEY